MKTVAFTTNEQSKSILKAISKLNISEVSIIEEEVDEFDVEAE
jgi:hypothetical protein